MYIDHTQFRLTKQLINKIFNSVVPGFCCAVVCQICISVSPRRTEESVKACVRGTLRAGNVLSGERTFTEKIY